MRKYSKQRELILYSLQQRKDHPTAETLYSDLKLKMPEIGIATVYRNLVELQEEGKIIKIKQQTGPDRFDGNVIPHLHFQCERCTKLIDILLPEKIKEKLDNEMIYLVKEIGAEVITTNITISGTCKECINNKEEE